MRQSHESEIATLRTKLDDAKRENVTLSEAKVTCEQEAQERLTSLQTRQREEREELMTQQRAHLQQALDEARTRWQQVRLLNCTTI